MEHLFSWNKSGMELGNVNIFKISSVDSNESTGLETIAYSSRSIFFRTETRCFALLYIVQN